MNFHVVAKFENGVELHIHDGNSTRKLDNGVLIEGTKGRIFVNRGRLKGKPVEWAAADKQIVEAMRREVSKVAIVTRSPTA